ncbi:MAG: DUF2007 domain-containing protein [Deltaproteobacteria bacterium]|nr:DUF2007 domain-containing protein [Deltaproteobacteria bacterium]
MRKEPVINHICVLKTGKLFEHDMAANALTENDIPFYKQMETSSGLRLAMPFQPTMSPGTYYNIFVPEKYSEEAKQILNELPIDITNNPDVFHFGANEKEKRGWKIYIWIILTITTFFLIINIVYNFI